MSDSGASYDKAIEETARATGKARDLVRNGGAGERSAVVIAGNIDALASALAPRRAEPTRSE
jgi:hypothetical protein